MILLGFWSPLQTQAQAEEGREDAEIPLSSQGGEGFLVGAVEALGTTSVVGAAESTSSTSGGTSSSSTSVSTSTTASSATSSVSTSSWSVGSWSSELSVDLDEDFLLLGLGSLGGGLLLRELLAVWPASHERKRSAHFAGEEVDNALSDKGGALKGSLGDLSDLLLAELESGGGLLGEVLFVRFLDLLWLLWGLLGIISEAGGSSGWLVRSAPSSITLSSGGLRSGLLVGGVLLALDFGCQ